MKTVKIKALKHFESSVLGSFTRGDTREVPPTWAKHFVDAGVAEYADAQAAGNTAESTAGASEATGAGEVSGADENGASGPESAPDGEAPKDDKQAKPRGGRKAKEQ